MKTHAFRGPTLLLPHSAFLHGTGLKLVGPDVIEFNEEPNFDDDGNCTSVERTMVIAEVTAAKVANKPAPKFAPRKKKKRQH